MKLKLLIATTDIDYAEHLSSYLSDKHSDTFDVSVASRQENFINMLNSSRYDVALLDSEFTTCTELGAIRLSFVLIHDSPTFTSSDIHQMRKYQRISAMVGDILEIYARENPDSQGMGAIGGRVTAVWSPVGGVGKTTVALAYAANRVAQGKRSVYLNLENFASTHVYFSAGGKSISKALEKLDADESNSQMLMLGMRQQDSGSGIFYFNEPDNYDDMAILTSEDTENLIKACAAEADELVVDLSSNYNKNVQKIFEIANYIFIVADPSVTTQTKLCQFIGQGGTFEHMRAKLILVNNKGARSVDNSFENHFQLPVVPTTDPISVYKSLSGGNFL